MISNGLNRLTSVIDLWSLVVSTTDVFGSRHCDYIVMVLTCLVLMTLLITL